jgi:O-antigen/teichoic acid export membrane protein
MTLLAEAGASSARRSLASNSTGLVAGKAVQMGTGYLFWLVAARTAGVHEVGVAAAAISAVMLCTQLGLLGVGAASIALLGRGRHPAAEVVGTALAVLGTAAAGAAIIAVVVIGRLPGDLGAAMADRTFAVSFVVASVFGTAIICFDQVSIALGHGRDTLPRYLVSGLLAVGLLIAASIDAAPVAWTLLACWTLDAVVSSAMGWVQARRRLGVWVRPRLRPEPVRELLRIGLPNHALTLAERAPALIVPVLTAQLASAATAAAWYPAWMMAWVAYTAPVAVGLAQFSAIVRQPERLRETTADALRWSLLLGGAIACVLIVVAGPVLSLLGAEYAASSTGALRVLALGLAPYAVLQAYNAVCRATGRLTEATVTGVVLGVVACGAAAATADQGATTMAVAWVGSFAAGAIWCGLRTLRITSAPAPSHLSLLTAPGAAPSVAGAD